MIIKFQTKIPKSELKDQFYTVWELRRVDTLSESNCAHLHWSVGVSLIDVIDKLNGIFWLLEAIPTGQQLDIDGGCSAFPSWNSFLDISESSIYNCEKCKRYLEILFEFGFWDRMYIPTLKSTCNTTARCNIT